MRKVWQALKARRTRGYLYRIECAAGAVAAGYGLVSGDELALWLGLGAAVLAIPPAANTPIRR